MFLETYDVKLYGLGEEIKPVHYKFRKSKFETARKRKWWKVGINDIRLT